MTDLQVYALGSWILAQLLYVEPIKINPLEECGKMTKRFTCPIIGCNEKRAQATDFKLYFATEHKDGGSVEELLELIKVKCPFKCGKSFTNVTQLPHHSSKCKFHLNNIHKHTFLCGNADLDCLDRYDVERDAIRHTNNHCDFQKNKQKWCCRFKGCAKKFGSEKLVTSTN